MKKIVIFIFCFFLLNINVFAYTKAPVDITELDIYGIQDAIDKGYLTYELLITLYLERIEAYDNEFNTIISINENAIEEAREKDIYYQENGRSSILYGIPIVVKDNIDVEGMPTTVGTTSLKDSYPNEDAEIIANLKKQGAIIIAKTNMSEFAFLATSSISSYGTVKNAYNTLYSSYGSSGGTAVAVSLQFATLGIGTDTNASLRTPASANNVIGFRPTLGLLSTEGIVAYDITRDTPGAITKTVSENAILTTAMANEEMYELDSSLKGKKIGVLTQFLNGDDSNLKATENTYTGIKTLFNDALNKLQAAGVEIVYIDDFYTNEYEKMNNSTLGGWTMCYAFNNYIKNTTSKINTFYELTYSSGHIYSLFDYTSDCLRDINKIETYTNGKEEIYSYVENTFEKYDVDFVVYPTTKNKLLKITDSTTNFSSPSSLIAPSLGLPAVSVSIGSDDGLYYGMEIVGLKNTEEELFNFIYGYEQINETYKLSELAEPLYTVPNSVKELIVYYEENKISKIGIDFLNQKDSDKYKESCEEIEEFFANYNSYDDVETKAKELLKEYTNNYTNLKEGTIYLVVASAIIILIFILMYKYLKIKRKANKRRRK